MATVQAGLVMSTKTVKAERVVETMTEGGVVEVEQTWHYTKEVKAIMGTGEEVIKHL